MRSPSLYEQFRGMADKLRIQRGVLGLTAEDVKLSPKTLEAIENPSEANFGEISPGNILKLSRALGLNWRITSPPGQSGLRYDVVPVGKAPTREC